MPYKWQLEKIAANRLKFWQDAKAEVERLEAINQQLLEACEAIIKAERLDWGSDPGLASAKAAGLARKAIRAAKGGE